MTRLARSRQRRRRRPLRYRGLSEQRLQRLDPYTPVISFVVRVITAPFWLLLSMRRLARLGRPGPPAPTPDDAVQVWRFTLRCHTPMRQSVERLCADESVPVRLAAARRTWTGWELSFEARGRAGQLRALFGLLRHDLDSARLV